MLFHRITRLARAVWLATLLAVSSTGFLAACDPSSAQAALLPVYQDDVVVFLGDSITSDVSLALNGWQHPYFEGYLSAGTFSGGRPGGKATTPTFINSGIGGQTAAGALASLTSLVTAYSPKLVVIELGVNDEFTGVSDGNFTTSYQAIISGIRTANGTSVRFLCLSILALGEKHTGGAWGANPYDAGILSKNAIIKSSCEAVGGVYADTRTPLLAWEIANNPSNDQTLHFCYDPVDASNGGLGVHPTWPGVIAPVSSTFDARVLVGQWAAAYVRVMHH